MPQSVPSNLMEPPVRSSVTAKKGYTTCPTATTVLNGPSKLSADNLHYRSSKHILDGQLTSLPSTCMLTKWAYETRKEEITFAEQFQQKQNIKN
ncbi:hypothetical protein TGAM01_v205732 [Trichoderma gamsii]|uniref:Uncharacterized protein n=1 Tax=Trichoderma gamsii TaxID=398673 RepID=A0A2P4ZMC7_9HYPO|nr:hypothetical protein TGAM01_v205732 [Trichoderma gamsii]PON25438.1 hypothetical protein TGAM01_v205732 [Trichoderma gamsii]